MSLLCTQRAVMHKILYTLMNHKVKNAVATLNAVYFLHSVLLFFKLHIKETPQLGNELVL